MFVFFSIVLIALSISAEIYFLTRGPLLRIMNILNLAYIYLLRPLAILSIGTSVLYAREFDADLYKIGWFLASLYILSENIGYFLTFPRLKEIRKNASNTFEDNIHSQKFVRLLKLSILWLTLVSVIFLFAMFLTAGTSFLAHNRNTAMAAVNPLLRYLYPFVQLAAALIAFSSMIMLFIYRKIFFGITTLILSLVLTAIIYQRGMMMGYLILAATVSFDLYRLRKKVNLRVLGRFLLILVLLFMIIVFLRDIYNLIVTRQFELIKTLRKEVANTANTFLLVLAIRPDGDILEVWNILLQFLSKNEPLLGKSLIRIPFAFASSNFRLSSGLKIGVDILNEYYDFNTYWYKKYGFNVNTAQEMVLNFSYVGVLFGFIVGVLQGILTRWYYKKLLVGETLKPAIYYSAASHFLSTFSGFQWMIFEIFFAEMISVLSKISIFGTTENSLKTSVVVKT